MIFDMTKRTGSGGGGGGGTTPLYPPCRPEKIKAGTVWMYMDNSVNGGHVKLQPTSTGGTYLVDIFNVRGGSSFSGSVEKLFTINSGDSCVLRVKNIFNDGNMTWNGNFRTPTNTAIYSGAFSLGDGTHTDGDITVSVTAPSNADVGYWFVYFGTLTANAILEFDLEFWVNGTRYI